VSPSLRQPWFPNRVQPKSTLRPRILTSNSTRPCFSGNFVPLLGPASGVFLTSGIFSGTGALYQCTRSAQHHREGTCTHFSLAGLLCISHPLRLGLVSLPLVFGLLGFPLCLSLVCDPFRFGLLSLSLCFLTFLLLLSNLMFFQTSDGLLRHAGCIYIPDLGNLRLHVLQYQYSHDHPLAGHYGQAKTLYLV